jgi:glycosyltransferase involved in cell wall biosynthesis
LTTRTGGYIYDRRIVEGLRARGWVVDVRELDEDFPNPSARSRERAARVLGSLSDGALVLIDGLAFGALPGEAAREAARLRLVALVHHPLALETGLDRVQAAALEESERRALASARRVVVTSRATADGLVGYGVSLDRITVVEPGTDRAPLARGSGGGAVHLLCVASIVPRKGHERLVEALASVPERNWRLACVGSLERDVRTTERLRQLIEAHGLADRIALVGEQDAAGVAAAYDVADVFVSASEHEGYGMAVAEAIARGVPVVAVPTGAIPHLVGEGDTAAGILVTEATGFTLEMALSLVIRDPRARARLAEHARFRRDRLPTWDDAGTRMAEALTCV